MKHFHVHIYFDSKDTQLAIGLKDKANEADLFESIKFHLQPIGPHPTGMIEMHFKEPAYALAFEWVITNRGNFTAMIHQDTGDDFTDHTQHIQWFGSELPLDFSFFELILERPDLRIHPFEISK